MQNISGFLVILSILYCFSESLPKDFVNTHSFVDNELIMNIMRKRSIDMNVLQIAA